MERSLIIGLIKIAVASLIVGVVLSAVKVTPDYVLARLGLTPDRIWAFMEQAVAWAVPHMILGACVTVPVWLVIYLLKPPAPRD